MQHGLGNERRGEATRPNPRGHERIAPARFMVGRRFAGPRQDLAEKILALTFDDGPDPRKTPRVLDALRERGAKATFFVLGHRVAKHPDIVRRMVDEGHVVGSHSWSHPFETTPEQARDELDRTHKAIRDACGVEATWFRPPYGIFTGNFEAYAKVRGYRTILWSVDTQDWKTMDVATTVQVAGEKTRRGDVVLMHDIHQPTVDAVPALLATLARRGLSSVTIAELLEPRRGMRAALGVKEAGRDRPAANPARPRPR